MLKIKDFLKRDFWNKKNLAISSVVVIIVFVCLALVFRQKHTATGLIEHQDKHLNLDQNNLLKQQLQSAEQALKNLPSSASKEDRFKAYTQVGAEHMALGELKEARSAFEAAAAILPNNTSSFQELYQIDLNMQDFAAAEQSIDKALAINPYNVSDWQSKITLEQVYFKISGDALEALYKDAIAKTKFVEFMATYAGILEQDGKLTEALDVWKRAVELAPTSDLHNLYKQSFDALSAKLKQKKN